MAIYANGQLLAAAPRYLKQDSWGEFVFDFAWAEAAQSIGRPWYPKAVVAVPFTPVPGPRLLGSNAAARQTLAESLDADEGELSSTHLLFTNGADQDLLESRGGLRREGLRLVWRNPRHGGFDDYLGSLRSRRRKEVRRERRQVADAGIRFECVNGADLEPERWPAIHALYAGTYHARGQRPYLAAGFWPAIAASPHRPVRVVLGHRHGELVCCALYLAGTDTLYGRHWGSRIEQPGLHFEACYYQGIELCIREGFSRYDAGVQGWQKLHRGFEPVIQTSAHFIADPELRSAIDRWLLHEREHIADQCRALRQHHAGPRA